MASHRVSRSSLIAVFASRSLIGVYIVGVSGLLNAQGSSPAFEVASVKRNAAGPGIAGRQSVQPGGRFVATHQQLSSLIRFAYEIGEPQLVGGPEWIKTEYFDIDAKAPGELPERQVRFMLQSLLEDRFRLVMRKEQREMPVQEITLDRADGRLGPRLVQVASLRECSNAIAKLPRVEAPQGAAWAMQCGSPSSILAQLIFNNLRTAAVDKTELTGTWVFTLTFAPQTAGFNAQNADLNVPSFVTAVREQLGLKIRATHALVDVLTIQSVQHPTEN